ncbi:MAG: protein-glutamate O-methyltransferase family protein [Chloroflexi bacterium]|nr:protein-glutamate O-methyltransferase family protein [Chloroflexota bacterium]
MTLLPPPILTSEPGSFARRTFEERIPRIVEDTIAANDFPHATADALRALRAEIIGGTIQPLRAESPDRAFWDEHARPFVGKTWLDVPWYWAEAFFYRRVLEATGYFQPGDGSQRDPYANQKDGELRPDAGPRALAAILKRRPESPENQFRTLLYASLWGNRADLSYAVAHTTPGSLALEQEHVNLVVDDSARVWEHLIARRGGRVDFVCDNAGTELLFDLALADFLLREGLASAVMLHLKPQPFFVSDAMVKDADAALAALAQSTEAELRHVGERLAQHRATGQLQFRTHEFWTTSLFFFQMPEDLRLVLAPAMLVIFKGDANYRRLLGDCHWLPTTPFAAAVGYFPAPLVALRTLKAELIVGLRPGEAERNQAQDPKWLVNAKRGVVQYQPS